MRGSTPKIPSLLLLLSVISTQSLGHDTKIIFLDIMPSYNRISSRSLHTYLYALKNVFKCPGYYAFLCRRIHDSLHGERLPTASLAVGKYGAVVAFSDTLEREENQIAIIFTLCITGNTLSRFYPTL